eukprot:GFUD01015198.1.p1 GENE.GFUD01015198.1~~GFUD01015198.1.p1  ORF type:complete len:371 (-),score=72.03 GFUD01015198.1:305-1417(-)
MGNVQDVEVAPIRNQRHAEVVAAEYIQNHPEYEWTGQWNATQPGGVSTIQIRRKELGASDVDDLLRTSQTSSSHRSTSSSGNTENRPQNVLPGLEDTLQSLQQSLPTFLSSGVGPSSSSGQGNPFQEGLTTLLNHSLNSATSSGEQSARSGQANLLQQSLNTFVSNTLNSGHSASGGQGTSFQQSLTTLLDDTLNIAYSSGLGQSASRGHGNSHRLTAASILPQFNSFPTTRTTGQTSSEVNELVSKFPEIAKGTIHDLLVNNDYNVDKTIEDLLKLVPDASNASEEGTSPKLSSNSSVPTPTCTVCWEALTPPKRIFQCTNGHLVCGVCQRQPQLQGKGCPTCRQPMIGRATAMEQFLADLHKSAKSKN